MAAQQWEQATRVQKNDAGEFRALIGGEWTPVERAQKNDAGDFRVMRFAAPETQPAAPAPAPEPTGLVEGVISTTKRLAAPYAGLADTLVSPLTGAVGQVAYPIARFVNSDPERAKEIATFLDRPFGKAIGVTETPEYRGEATQRVVGAVGDVVEKGVNRLAQVTGLPAQDVGNMFGTATLALPAVGRAISKAPQVQTALESGRVVRDAGGAVLAAGKEKMAAMREPARQAASEKAYARGAQIDAAKEAQRLGVAIDPRDMNPESRGAKITSAWAGERGVNEIQKANVSNVRRVALEDMNLPKEADLTKGETFDNARTAVSKPYDQIARLPTVVADADTLDQIRALIPEGHLIGKEAKEAAVGRVVDSADRLMTEGLTGQQMLDNISTLRKEARKVYDAKSPDLPALEAADAKLAIANILEGVVEKNIPDPGLLKEFRAARTEMAKLYAYEGAVNKNTGLIEVDRLAKVTSKGGPYTGKLESLGKIAGNFPYAFSNNPALGGSNIMGSGTLGRSTIGGATAGSAGYAAGGYGAAVPASIVGGIADIAQRARIARRMASPEYQKRQFIPDARIRVPETEPVNNLGPTVPIGREVVPFVEKNPDVLSAYRPNWVPGGRSPLRPVRPDQRNALPAPSAEATMNALRTEDARQARINQSIEADRRAARGRAAAAEDARIMAEEAARPRAPAAREKILELDPITGRFRTTDQGIKGATPEIIRDTGASLKSATEKLVGRQTFAMSAEEKIAWNKTRIDLAAVDPGLNKLSDKAVANKMLDRAWVEQTIQRAREKDKLFADIAARAKSERERQAALVEREKIQDLLTELEEKYRAPRVVVGQGQGPKTRAHQKNALREAQAKNNALR